MTRRVQDRAVVVGVTTSSFSYCSNDCLHHHVSATTEMVFVAKCQLFDSVLSLDKRRKNDPYRRLKICKDSEYMGHDV